MRYEIVRRKNKNLVRLISKKNMNFKKILSGFVIALSIAAPVLGQQLKMKRRGNIVRVVRGKKLLYNVVLKGRENMAGRKYDEAFLAGACLIVRRDIREMDTGTESYPDVSRLEIYQANGKRKIYRESHLAISRVDGWGVINSPGYTWAIVPDSGEGIFSGYFHISRDCRLSEVSFFPNGEFDWFGADDGIFINEATFKFPSLLNRPASGQGRKMNIFITKDGKYRLEDIEK